MQDLFSVFKGSAAALSHETIRVVWESPSNIALVKYWGKRSGQLPANPSLSMTLSRAYTRTAAEVRKTSGAAELVSLNGNPQHPFLLKLRPFFQWLTQQMPVLEGYSCSITTENSFPHSTGIASSASGISAFTLCMIDVASQIAGLNMSDKHLLQLASFAARMGSGSACRSLYGGFSALGRKPGTYRLLRSLRNSHQRYGASRHGPPPRRHSGGLVETQKCRQLTGPHLDEPTSVCTGTFRTGRGAHHRGTAGIEIRRL